MPRQSQVCAFYCDNPLTLLCIYNVSFEHISFLIKYSFEGRLPILCLDRTPSSLPSIIPSPLNFFIWVPPNCIFVWRKPEKLNQLQLPLSKGTQKQRESSWGQVAPYHMCFTQYYLLFSTEQPVPAPRVCVHFYYCVRVLFVTCIARCITSDINQSSSLVIRQLQFPACRSVKRLCKPPWEINTINTARFNRPTARNIFKYLSTVFPQSSSISPSLCHRGCPSLLFRCTKYRSLLIPFTSSYSFCLLSCFLSFTLSCSSSSSWWIYMLSSPSGFWRGTE